MNLNNLINEKGLVCDYDGKELELNDMILLDDDLYYDTKNKKFFIDGCYHDLEIKGELIKYNASKLLLKTTEGKYKIRYDYHSKKMWLGQLIKREDVLPDDLFILIDIIRADGMLIEEHYGITSDLIIYMNNSFEVLGIQNTTIQFDENIFIANCIHSENSLNYIIDIYSKKSFLYFYHDELIDINKAKAIQINENYAIVDYGEYYIILNSFQCEIHKIDGPCMVRVIRDVQHKNPYL